MSREAGRTPGADARRWRLLGALACAGTIACALPSLPRAVSNWDNVVKLQVAINILEGRGPILTQPTPDDAQYVVEGRDGRRYTGYPPFAFVLQFLTIGAAAVGGPIAEGLPPLVLLGLVAWTLVAWGRESGASPPGAVAGAMLACLGTALWPMATHGYDNLIEVLALGLVLRAGAGEDRGRAWLLAGLAVGLAFATRLSAAVLGAPALALMLLRPPRAPRAVLGRGLAFTLGCLPGLSLVLWYNQIRFGSLFTVFERSAAHGTIEQLVVPWFSRHHWEGMLGLAISPGKGLPWYGPPLVAVALLAVPLGRRYRAAYATLLVHALVAVVLFGRFVYWHGEWGWGPRYVAPLYLAVAPLGWWLVDGLGRRRVLARVAMAAALVLAVALQAAPVVGYPVASYFSSTMLRLSRSGLLATSPVTRPPLPADNHVLYYRIENSPIVSLSQTLPRLLRDPTQALPVRRNLAAAMLVPAFALALVLVAGREEADRPSP
jgi:hypothetical protein